MNMKTLPIALLGLGCLASSQGLAAPNPDVVLQARVVHTVTGQDISPGEVRFSDGLITAIGTTVDHSGAQVVALTNQHLYPGLIALDTGLGLAEISGVRATLDLTEVGDYTPEVESWLAANPDSELIPVARANGIVCFEPVPQGGTVSGLSGLISVEGWTTEQRAIKKAMALHIFWPSMDLSPPSSQPGAPSQPPPRSLEDQARERRTKIRELDDFFEEARAYAKARTAAATGGTSPPALIPAWEAMLPVVTGEVPVMIHANELRQIQTAVAWARERKMKIIIAGGRDAGLVADLLGTNRIPVIFEHVFTQPQKDTLAYDFLFRTPELLRKAGTICALSIGADSFNAALTRNLPYAAAQCAAFGCPREEALRMITLNPAEIAGVANHLGSLSTGKDATVFSADGDILDARTNVKRMWIRGAEVTLSDRQTRLYDRYRNRPKTAQAK